MGVWGQISNLLQIGESPQGSSHNYSSEVAGFPGPANSENDSHQGGSLGVQANPTPHYDHEQANPSTHYGHEHEAMVVMAVLGEQQPIQTECHDYDPHQQEKVNHLITINELQRENTSLQDKLDLLKQEAGMSHKWRNKFAKLKKQYKAEKQAMIQRELAFAQEIARQRTQLESNDDEIKRRTRENDRLMNDFMRVCNERPCSKKDDSYLKGKFHEIFGSIQDWVLNNFIQTTVDAASLKGLDTDFREILGFWFGPQWEELLLEDHVSFIFTFISRVIREYFFMPFLAGYCEKEYSVIAQGFEPEDEKYVQFRISTVKRLTQGASFKEFVDSTTDSLAATVSKSLLPLARKGSKERSREKRLRAIFQQIVILVTEINMEPSEFYYPIYNQNDRFLAAHMEDPSGLEEGSKLEKQGVKINMTIFPEVVRKSYENGHDIVLFKARVWTSPANDMPLDSDKGPELEAHEGDSGNLRNLCEGCVSIRDQDLAAEKAPSGNIRLAEETNPDDVHDRTAAGSGRRSGRKKARDQYIADKTQNTEPCRTKSFPGAQSSPCQRTKDKVKDIDVAHATRVRECQHEIDRLRE